MSEHEVFLHLLVEVVAAQATYYTSRESVWPSGHTDGFLKMWSGDAGVVPAHPSPGHTRFFRPTEIYLRLGQIFIVCVEVNEHDFDTPIGTIVMVADR